jgi:poly(3-hydroxybutyrate) depolymerase
MRKLLVLAALVVVTGPSPAAAQLLPSIAAIQDDYTRLKATAKPDDSTRREVEAVDRAVAEAVRQGRAGEVRRLVAKGTALLQGTGWSEVDDFANSVVLRSDRLIADPVRPLALRVEQIYLSTLVLPSPPGVSVVLHRMLAPDQVPAGKSPVGTRVRDYGTFQNVSRDLRESPVLVDLDLTGLGDGTYALIVSLTLGDRLIARRGLSFEVRRNLDARLQRLEVGARKSGALVETYRSDILYPVDHVRLENRGAIDVGPFDVERALSEAESTLAAVESRRDPFSGRTGQFTRHYLFVEAGEIMPYTMFVPASYSPRKPSPLIVALHGSGGDHDAFFAGGPQRQLPVLAEEHGFLVVAPLGYRVNGGYGRTSPTASQDPALVRRRELSEADVLHVIDIVRRSYTVDENRIYLLGHSMGAAGAWHLGAEFPERWAAIACIAGSGNVSDVQRMRGLPQLVVHGDADATVPVARSRAMVDELKRLGVEHKYIEVRGGDHSSVFERYVEEAIAYFEKHRRGGKQ